MPNGSFREANRFAPDLKEETKRSLQAAVRFACSTQHRDGYWETPSDPRIFDTAIVSLCLAKAGSGASIAVERARKWLMNAVPQCHDPVVTELEEWLRVLALGAEKKPAPNLSNTSRTWSGRVLLVESISVIENCPYSDAAHLLDIVGALRGKRVKQWQRTLLAAAEIIADARLGNSISRNAVTDLVAEQRTDGGFCLMPAISAVACIALLAANEQEAARNCLTNLLENQCTDGTWRYLPFDIWDTALMVRALRGCRLFDEKSLAAALSFVERTQSDDGGWACKRGLESDNDTTGAALLALAGSAAGRRVTSRAVDYLRRVQRDDGLWMTWQSADDVPSPDVTAHVVSAATTHSMTSLDTSRAVRWLVKQYEEAGWSAHWYPTKSYAVREISVAIGIDHKTSRRAAQDLITRQRADGGWPAFDHDSSSSAAATGLALSVLARSKETPDQVLRNAASFLIGNQSDQGTWVGSPFMAGPRPLLNHYPSHTHAFASTGLHDFLKFALGNGKR